MDSKERHELEQNDLEAFVSNFGEWWQKRGTLVLSLIAIAALGFAAYRLTSTWAYESHEAAWGDLAMATSPESLSEAAMQGPPAVRAVASLRAGDMLLETAINPAKANEADAPTDAERQDLLARAQGAYEVAYEVADDDLYRANALLGLAAVAESKGEFDAARDYYQKVEALSGSHMAGLVARAKARAAMLDEISTPVEFGPEPEPEAAADPADGVPAALKAPEAAPSEAAPEPADAPAE